MDFGIANKVALIANGTRRCGLATARELICEGVRVILADPDARKAEAAVQEIRRAGGEAMTVIAEATDTGGPATIVAAAQAGFGLPDIVILDPPPPPSPEGFDATTDDDLRLAHRRWNMGLVGLARRLVPTMQARRWGRFVTFASLTLKEPSLKTPRYGDNLQIGAAAFSKTLAHEFGGNGITANVLALGLFEGDDDAIPLYPTALKRRGRPEEAAAVAAFLCSERASYLTGEIIRIDGARSDSIF